MSQFITPSINAPPPRDLGQELTQIHNVQKQFAPQDYKLEAKYGPKYNRLDLQKASENLLGYHDDAGQYHPGTLSLGRTAATTTRAGDISDVEKFGSRASQAVLNANPYLRTALTSLNARMKDSPLLSTLNARAQTAGSPLLTSLNARAQTPDALLSGLNTQARAGLASGGQLSQQDIDALAQQSRSGFADRGIVMGNQSLGAELLSRDAAVRQRLAAAQQFAGNVEGMNQQQNQFGLGVQGANQQQNQFGLGVQGLNQAQNQFVAQGTQIDSSTLSDPFMSILGRPANAQATAGLPGGGGGGRVYNPMDYASYSQDLFNTNYSAGINLGIAEGNNQAATRAAIASIAGAGIKASDERLKENIVTVGKSPKGHRIVEFNYIANTARRYRGVIAQEAEKIAPEAVFTGENGYKHVDYEKLDVKMEEVT